MPALLRPATAAASLAAILGLAAAPRDAAADDAAADEALRRLERALEAETGLGRETRDALRDALGALRRERGPGGGVAAELDAYLAKAAGGPARAGRWSMSADLRLRQESHFHLDAAAPDRHRQRARLRLAIDAALTDGLAVGTRFTTGAGTDPNSPHQTLGTGMRNFEVRLDRAFLRWDPAAVPGLRATAGKFGMPGAANPVYGETVWDADLQPEGAALTFGRDGILGLDRFDVGVGEFVLLEQGAADEASLFAAHAGARHRPSEAFGLAGGATWYRYHNTTPDDAAFLLGENAGNAVVTPPGGSPEFASEFSIIDAFLAVEIGGLPRPLTLAAQWIRNFGADGGADDRGWAFGAAYGTLKAAGDTRWYAQVQAVEREALFSAFAQDDFLAATGYRAVVAGVVYRVTDALDIHVWALATEAMSGGGVAGRGTQWRCRIDFNIRF